MTNTSTLRAVADDRGNNDFLFPAKFAVKIASEITAEMIAAAETLMQELGFYGINLDNKNTFIIGIAEDGTAVSATKVNGKITLGICGRDLGLFIVNKATAEAHINDVNFDSDELIGNVLHQLGTFSEHKLNPGKVKDMLDDIDEDEWKTAPDINIDDDDDD